MEPSPLFLLESDSRYDFRRGTTVRRATVHIQAGVCVYWKSPEGPCTMCPLPVYQREFLGGKRPEWSALFPAVQSGWNEIKGEKPDTVRIFHGGNTIVEEEVSAESQVGLIEFFSSQPSVNTVVVESKPEYVSRDRIERLMRARTRPVKLQMNMGVESHSEGVRRQLQKGFTDDQYRRAVDLLADVGVDRLAYLIIQPISVPPEYAIDSLMESVRWVTDIDPVTEVSALALYVDKKTVAYKAWERGEFTPPSLPTVARAVIAAREAHPKGWVSFGGVRDNDVIEPAAYSKGCATCHDPLMAALKCYYTDCEIEPLKKALASVTPCGCG